MADLQIKYNQKNVLPQLKRSAILLLAAITISGSSVDASQYAVVSLHDDVDKIIESYGAIEAGEKDLMRNQLRVSKYEPIYGEADNAMHLREII